MIEALADAVDDAFFQRMLVDDRGIEERCQHRILLGGEACLLAQAAPDRIHQLERFRLTKFGRRDHRRTPS
ncbi:hypothetical protein D3C86_1985830 [compost metagenome]